MANEALKSVESFNCLVGSSAQRPVLLGFASAKLLHALSFADVLNEDTGRGYQRRPHSAHSLGHRLINFIQIRTEASLMRAR